MFHVFQMAAVSAQFKFQALCIADMNHQLFEYRQTSMKDAPEQANHFAPSFAKDQLFSV